MGCNLPGFFKATEMPSAGWWEALWPDPAKVLAAVGLRPGMDAIDLCSGDGLFTLHIAKVAHHVIAIDIDTNMLEAARYRLRQNAINNCDFVEGDAYDLPRLTAQPVDFIFMANAFHGVPDQPRLGRVLSESLKWDGWLAVVNWDNRPREETTIMGEPRGPKTHLRMSPQQTIDAVKGSGLTPAQIVELPPYHYGAVFNRSRPRRPHQK